MGKDWLGGRLRRKGTYMAPTKSWMLTTILLCRLICRSTTHTIGTLKMMTSVIRFAMPVPSHPARGAAQ